QQRADDDLGQRLIRQAFRDGEQDVMADVMRLMGESARQLEVKLEVGEETQTVQARTMDRLNEAILQAAAQQRAGRPEPGRQVSDKRKSSPRPKKSSGDKDDGTAGDGPGRSAAAPAAVSPQDSTSRRGELSEQRRSWGHLPEREREEIIQGNTEESLEEYREWIESYYRALQEQDD
ncbi:MAG: hypothetical protein KJ749_08230, partial [Planctomycetes bacterium]|nr:hypothetical protein [Planctomycetota bacterium]